MSSLVCQKCQKRFETYEKDVLLVELQKRPVGPAVPFVIWRAVIQACPGCGFKAVKIRDRTPFATCLDKDFDKTMERIITNKRQTVVYVVTEGQ